MFISFEQFAKQTPERLVRGTRCVQLIDGQDVAGQIAYLQECLGMSQLELSRLLGLSGKRALKEIVSGRKEADSDCLQRLRALCSCDTLT